MMDLWTGLKQRLRAVANNKNGDKYAPPAQGVARIEFELFMRRGALVGYTRPERTPYEPKSFDCACLDLEPTRDWDTVIKDLQRYPTGHKILVVKDAMPRGWLRVAVAYDSENQMVRV